MTDEPATPSSEKPERPDMPGWAETLGAGAGGGAMPSLADLQHWTWVMGRAQQMMLEQGLAMAKAAPATPAANPFAQQVQDFWADSLSLWQRFLDPAAPRPEEPAAQAADKRFRGEAWRANPVFDWIRQSYFMIADHMLRGIDAIEGVDEGTAEELQARARDHIEAAARAALENARALGAEDSLIEFEGLTAQMVEALAKDGVRTLEDFATCADWELAGGWTTQDGQRVKDDGLLEPFGVTLEQAQDMVMTARVMLGWVDPDELHPAPTEDETAPTEEAGV